MYYTVDKHRIFATIHMCDQLTFGAIIMPYDDEYYQDNDDFYDDSWDDEDYEDEAGYDDFDVPDYDEDEFDDEDNWE